MRGEPTLDEKYARPNERVRKKEDNEARCAEAQMHMGEQMKTTTSRGLSPSASVGFELEKREQEDKAVEESKAGASFYTAQHLNSGEVSYV